LPVGLTTIKNGAFAGCKFDLADRIRILKINPRAFEIVAYN